MGLRELKSLNGTQKLILVGSSGWVTFIIAMLSCAAENLPSG